MENISYVIHCHGMSCKVCNSYKPRIKSLEANTVANFMRSATNVSRNKLAG